jgi:hypothetical protein
VIVPNFLGDKSRRKSGGRKVKGDAMSAAALLQSIVIVDIIQRSLSCGIARKSAIETFL